MDAVERIGDLEHPYALLIRAHHAPERTQFLTPDSATQQLGFIVHRAGHRIQPHIHKLIDRVVPSTTEVLIVRSGRVRVDIYDTDRRPFTSRELGAGDVILLLRGGHGFEILEDAVMLEVKQGPYIGQDEKETFPA
jgi:hypothetical protein